MQNNRGPVVTLLIWLVRRHGLTLLKGYGGELMAFPEATYAVISLAAGQCSSQMKGGKVNRNPAASIAYATTLIRLSRKLRVRQRTARSSQANSQTPTAPVLTPESGPLGRQMLKVVPTTGHRSPAVVKRPSASEPIPVARIAAAPRPFGRDPRTSSGVAVPAVDFVSLSTLLVSH